VSEVWRDPLERRKRIAVAGGVLIAMGLVSGWWSEVLSDVVLAAVALVAGGEIGVRAWRALRLRQVGIELLVTVAAAGALVLGEVWEAAAVTWLFVLGGWLEARTLSGTRRAVARLLETAPATAVVVRGGEQVEVAVGEVGAGELVLVKPGMRVSVDGVVEGGYAAVDESTITGEPVPAEKGPGERVYAGTIVKGGLLRIRATGVGRDTVLARIIRRVEEAQESKVPAQRFIERFARWYTPLILVLGGAAWLVTGDARLALTLLVIACPGALVIAIPVSVVAGIGRAAREGILIKGGEQVERLGRVTAVALDKTGTLTEGRPRLTDVVALVGEPVGVGGEAVCGAGAAGSVADCGAAQRAVLWLAAIAENGSEHPVGRPIVEAARALGVVPQPDRLEAVVGRGVRAEAGGARIEIGSVAALREWAVAVPARAAEWAERIARQGRTPLLVARDGAVVGVLGVADAPWENAVRAVRRLRELGVGRIALLTGDGGSAARAVAAATGIAEVHAGLLPGEKLDRVRRMQAEGGVVAAVGDGVNDAPALAGADVGIAMGAAGSDVAIETAGVALMADDLEKVPRAIEIGRRIVANMRQNLAVALVTVAALLAGVLLGEVHMAGGMMVHQLSVLGVIGNGMRLLRG